MAQKPRTKTKPKKAVQARTPLPAANGAATEHPGITKTPGVCGGSACIARTRFPVWGLYRAKLAGASDAELLRRYPSLSRKKLRDAWKYAESHESEIKQQIEENSW